MTGPSIVVPPAMPQRSLPPRPPHSTSNGARNPHQGAKTVKGPNSGATKPVAVGRKEHVATRRTCSVSSCPNLIDPGWPWKRCKRCTKENRGREVRNATNPLIVSVDVACVSCFAAFAVPVNELTVGQPYVCRPCRERSAAFSRPAFLQPATHKATHRPAPPRSIVVHDAPPPPKRDVTSLGHGQPPVSRASHSNASIHVPTPPPPPPPPQGQFVPMPIAPDASKGTNNFDAIMRFVHPDHRHILGYRDDLVPPPASQIAPAPDPAPASELVVASAPPASPKEPPVKLVRLTIPHYSRTGEILAVLPEDVGLKRSSLPPAKAPNGPPLAANGTETENVAGSSSTPFAQVKLHTLETPRKVSVTHTQDGSIKIKIPPKHSPPPPIAPAPIPTPSDNDNSLHAPGENAGPSSSLLGTPAPPRKKRKRPQRAANRLCESPGCENVIPPRFKGSRCVQCGFARWSTVFRERFDGIRADLIQAGIAGAGPAVTVKENSGTEEDTPSVNKVQKQPAVEERTPSVEGVGVEPSTSAATPSLERPPSTTQHGVAPRTSTVLHSSIPPPSVFRKPSIRSVKLIVSPRHTESDPAVGANPLDPGASSSRTETPLSGAADIPRPKIKSIKLRVSVPPDSHTPSTVIPAANTNDTTRFPTSPLTDLDTENEQDYPMVDAGHDQETSNGDTTDSEASIPLAYRYAATDTKNRPPFNVPDTAEADGEDPMSLDHDLEDHTGDTTESEASVPLADWAPSNIPSTTPRSTSLLPIRRVRLILGPNPARAPSPSPSPSSSRESSPDLALSLVRPFSVRRRWEALGWDTDESDLTPIEDSADEDEGESEIDLPESSDEEGEGGDGSTGTRLSIVIPRRTEKPPVKHRWQCANPRCASLLAHGSFFKNCDACRKRIHLLRKQERKRDRLEGAVPSRYDDSEFHIHITPDADLTGYRRCSHQRCNHLIPPESQYRYRTCGPCRAQKRRQWWRRKGLEPPGEGASLRKSASASIMERAIANAVRTAAKEEGPATGKRKRQAVDGAREGEGEGAGGEKLMEMPPYQHFAALLDSLRSRFSQFKAVQTRYVQLKALTGADSKPMVFNFDGEYSVVTDPSGGSVDGVVSTVVRNVHAALDLRFQPAAVHSGPEESVIASLSGVYVAKIPRLSKESVANTADANSTPPTEASTLADSAADAPLEVTMGGELHICVAWDRRHRFFPGQRIMLRFRLVG